MGKAGKAVGEVAREAGTRGVRSHNAVTRRDKTLLVFMGVEPCGTGARRKK